MTPLQFVKAKCANHQASGSCLGAMYDEQLRITRCVPKPRCLIADGKRCPYFEECVMPMAEIVTDAKRVAELHAAVMEYRRMTLTVEKTKPCRLCQQPRQPGKSFCPTCAERQRKTSNREAQRRRRTTDVGLSAFLENNAPNSLGKSGAFSASTQNPYQDSHHPQNRGLTADTARPKESQGNAA
ncbi:MAG: hypothetical protein NTY53_08850 [Kiritimatiellaeota bacterium]|nr:hypothetical protein [Kiritimatiellota bacterium]